MKKKRIVSAVSLLTAVCLLAGSQVYGNSTEYNDNNYKTYGNLAEDSAVPSLFKNDDVFTNYKNYPPVISDGVEYVPLELFYGLSNVKINYSDDNTNFYIQNKETNEYISFSVTDNYAVTGQNRVYETNVPTYYGVHYVPLRTVCDTVGIGCSTYNDGENKIYAIEVYTGEESLSAQELLQIHAPELYQTNEPEQAPDVQEPVQDTPTTSSKPATADKPTAPSKSETDKKPQDTTGNKGSETSYITPNTGGYIPIEEAYPSDDNTDDGPRPSQNDPQTTAGEVSVERPGSDNTAQTTGTQEQTDGKKEEPKAPEYKSGSVMLFYTPEEFENAEKTLDALDMLGIKAVFFVTESDILDAPGTIRRIYASGHSIGITFDQAGEELFAPGVLEEKTESAENALYEVAKIKTRLVYFGEIGDDELMRDILKRSEVMGLCVAQLNGDARTDSLSPARASEKMRNDLRDIRRNYGSNTAFIRMRHTDSAISAAGAVAAVAMTHREIKIEVFEETDIGRY